MDDFWIAGDDSFVKDVIEKIRTVFKLGSIIEIPHKYPGLVVKLPNSGSGLCLDMDSNRAGLQEMPIEDTSNKERNLSEEEATAQRGIIGKLLWPAKQARRDICLKLSELASLTHKATVSVALSANKLVCHVNSGPPITMRYPSFSDAPFNNYSDGYTPAGFINFIAETNTNKSAVLAWKSAKLRRVARSTLAVECFSLIECPETVEFCRNILLEIPGIEIPIVCCTDNRSIVESAYSNNSISDISLRVDIGFLRNTLSNGCLSRLKWIETKRQVSHCLKKSRSPSSNLLCTVLQTNSLSAIFIRN